MRKKLNKICMKNSHILFRNGDKILIYIIGMGRDKVFTLKPSHCCPYILILTSLSFVFPLILHLKLGTPDWRNKCRRRK